MRLQTPLAIILENILDTAWAEAPHNDPCWTTARLEKSTSTASGGLEFTLNNLDPNFEGEELMKRLSQKLQKNG